MERRNEIIFIGYLERRKTTKIISVIGTFEGQNLFEENNELFHKSMEMVEKYSGSGIYAGLFLDLKTMLERDLALMNR